MLAASVSIAQNLNKRISIEIHDQPLGEVIRLISEKGDILFSFNPQSIPIDKKITVVASNTALSILFKKVFTANGIDYSVSEKQVILKIGRAHV